MEWSSAPYEAEFRFAMFDTPVYVLRLPGPVSRYAPINLISLNCEMSIFVILK